MNLKAYLENKKFKSREKTVLLFICTFMCICAVSAFQGPDRITPIDDFEQDNLVFSVDGDGIRVGYVEFFGSGGNISTNLTNTPPTQVPDAPIDNQVLDLTMTLPSNSFAGLVHNFTNAAADTWVTMDWSSYQGISLWIYGNNTGELLFLDVLDNRNVNSMVDDAQRWSVDIPDDFSGWRFFQFEWEDFTVKPVFPT